MRPWRTRVSRCWRRDRKSTRLNSSHANISYAVFCLTPPPPRAPLFPYTTLFRSAAAEEQMERALAVRPAYPACRQNLGLMLMESEPERAEQCFRRVIEEVPNATVAHKSLAMLAQRSEEHTSELQSRQYLVCRLLLDPATTACSTLSLHDALPICCGGRTDGTRARGASSVPSMPPEPRPHADGVRAGARGAMLSPRHRGGPECDRGAQESRDAGAEIGRAHV